MGSPFPHYTSQAFGAGNLTNSVDGASGTLTLFDKAACQLLRERSTRGAVRQDWDALT